MQYDPREHKKHNRQSIRLRGYDYSLAGFYFITICVNERRSLFGDVVEGKMQLSVGGKKLYRAWNSIPSRLPATGTDCFVVMPNHVHGIIALTDRPIGCGIAPQVSSGAPVCTNGVTLPEIVRWFKAATTNMYRAAIRRRGWPRYEKRLWQRNYYEHIIRDAESLSRIREYISTNPERWSMDCENPDCVAKDPFDMWFETTFSAPDNA